MKIKLISNKNIKKSPINLPNYQIKIDIDSLLSQDKKPILGNINVYGSFGTMIIF